MNNIFWQSHKIKAQDRELLLNQKGCCLWFTGLSGSGKSTIANEVEFLLYSTGYSTYLLDGDNVRSGINKDLGFSNDDREENIRRVREISNLFIDAGIIVLSSFISPFKEHRNRVRRILPENKFVEIFVDCDLDTCEGRDPKGLYKKARNGELKNFTGISSPYQKPDKPEITIANSDNSSVAKHAEKIYNYLVEEKLIKHGR